MIDIFQAWLMHVFPTFTSIHGFLHACISYIILLSLTHTSGLRTLREGPFSLAFSASSHIHVSVAFQKLHHPANLLLQEPQLKCTTELLNEQKEPTEAGSVYLPCWFFWATTCICLMAYFSLLFFAGENLARETGGVDGDLQRQGCRTCKAWGCMRTWEWYPKKFLELIAKLLLHHQWRDHSLTWRLATKDSLFSIQCQS